MVIKGFFVMPASSEIASMGKKSLSREESFLSVMCSMP